VTRVLAIVGPTATGKSALGIALAQALGGEVVNTDSMQLYRGMDIGTAKLTTGERCGVRHHLLDIWDVTEAASVAEYQRLARSTVDALLAAGRVPVLVGGSGLYVRAVLDRMEFPGTDPSTRADLEADLAAVGPGALHARLAQLDPAAAAAILPSNGRRIVRALEVIALTGRPFTAILPSPEPFYDAVQIGLDLVWAAGLVEEVRALEKVGLRDGPTASRALGYAQVLRYFDGELDSDGARAHTQQATRRFVRRQRSWFRRDDRVRWLDASRPDLVDAALSLIR
jgi:tRNA dimethylallyltransferase